MIIILLAKAYVANVWLCGIVWADMLIFMWLFLCLLRVKNKIIKKQMVRLRAIIF